MELFVEAGEDCLFAEAWVARHEDGRLTMYGGREPEKNTFNWIVREQRPIKKDLDPSMFPDVKWTDKRATRIRLSCSTTGK